MGIFAPKNIFPCTNCAEAQLTQEEIDALPKSSKIHLSKSDIQNLNNTPITLVSAKSGKAIDIISVLWKYTYINSPYSAGGTISIKTNTVTNPWGGLSIQTYTTDINGYIAPISTTLSTSRWTVNQDVVVYAGAAVGSGDGTLDLYVLYRYVTI